MEMEDYIDRSAQSRNRRGAKTKTLREQNSRLTLALDEALVSLGKYRGGNQEGETL
jgi:hypothetical protein